MKLVKGRNLSKSKEHKMIILGIIFFVVLIAFVAIPTLSSYKNRTLSQSVTVWDGTVADSYRSGDGTEENPYIIANGEELAYFASELKTTNYEGKYFKLSNNIVLNDGMFTYDKVEGIKYLKEDDENNSFNKFQHLNNFKGTFDGDYYTIFGVYIDEILNDGQNALFTNLEGNIKNLYIENSIIYGGKITAGVASKSNNATLTNVLYDGFVISDDEVYNDVIEKRLEDVTLNSQGVELNDNLSITDLDYIPGLITEVILSGNVNDNLDGILKINGENISSGYFEINLGNKLLTTIPLFYQSSTESNVSLTDLKYNIKYNYGNASGIISIAEETTLQNIVNKASVSASVYGAGIINFVNGNTILKNVYNIGEVNSDNISSGLISGINQNKKDTEIINCYNDGKLNSLNNSMIGSIEYNSGNVIFNSVFNPQDNYVINLVDNSNVLVSNSYAIASNPINLGNINGEFINVTKENFEDKIFVQNKLGYGEFVEDESDLDSAWLFLDKGLPKVFIDYSYANIHISDYKWDNYNSQLEILNFSKEFVFNVRATNELNTIKEVYYYVSNSEDVLSKFELNQINDWVKYEDIVEIKNEGKYIIYAKIISANDMITYINTDLIMFDLTGADIIISTAVGGKSWNNLRDDLGVYYIDDKLEFIVNTEDNLSGVKEIYYYNSDKVLNLEELQSFEKWDKYENGILINNKKTIVYVKVIDNCENISYAGSDFIILNGYTLDSIYPGMNGDKVDNLYITENSSVSLNFSYLDVVQYKEGNKHQLISNVLLPKDTIITIIDKIKNKVYKYTTTSDDYGYDECLNNNCSAIYDFELFNEVGTTNKFKESSYTDLINEEFIVNIDFKNTKIIEDIDNVMISLNLYNELDVKNTILSTMKKFGIRVLGDAYFTLTSQFNDTIKYSENENYVVDFSTKLNYKYLNGDKIYDTTFDDKNLGLAIKMLYPNGDVVEKKYLKNILFQVGNKNYSPSSDGIVRINLNSGISDITNNLVIETFKDNSKLEKGNYKFEMSLYAAYDGVYSNKYLTKLDIPVYVGENSYNNNINFNVEINSEDKIVTTDNNEFNFKFLLSNNTLENYGIKLSLYKKYKLSAYDQSYTLVDLGNYLVSPILDNYGNGIYYASKDVKNNDVLNIKLNTSLLEKNGYMFVFELYNGDKVLSKVNKKFIVK